MTQLSKWVTFRDSKLEAKYANSKIPMNTLVEGYLDEKLDIPGDLYAVMRQKELFVNYRPTVDQARFFVEKFIPSVVIHSKKQDQENEEN